MIVRRRRRSVVQLVYTAWKQNRRITRRQKAALKTSRTRESGRVASSHQRASNFDRRWRKELAADRHVKYYKDRESERERDREKERERVDLFFIRAHTPLEKSSRESRVCCVALLRFLKSSFPSNLPLFTLEIVLFVFVAVYFTLSHTHTHTHTHERLV